MFFLEGVGPQGSKQGVEGLAAEAVQGAALALEGVHDVHGGDSLPLGVLGVGHGVTDDVLQEHLEHPTGLLVDEAGDTLDSTSACQTADGGLGDALDVVTQNLAMTLGATLSQALASFASSRHDEMNLFSSVQNEGNNYPLPTPFF